jgi:hypothetical protein
VFHRPLRRPLAIVSLLSVVDYLLWNWSFSGGHDVLTIVAGLTLTPLLIALLWLLVVGATRLLAGATRRARSQSYTRAGGSSRRRGAAGPRAGEPRTTAESRSARGQRAATGAGAGEAPSSASPSSKLAA